MCRGSNVLKKQSIEGAMCPSGNVSSEHCAEGAICLGNNVSNEQCVKGAESAHIIRHFLPSFLLVYL